MASDDQRKVYDQEWQNYRSQDNLRWSRFQTVALIEGAYLAAIYTTTLSPGRGLFLAFFASALVSILCWLAYKDSEHADRHLDRARLLEKELVESGSPRPGRRVGHCLMLAAIGIVNVFNVVVIVDSVFKMGSSSRYIAPGVLMQAIAGDTESEWVDYCRPATAFSISAPYLTASANLINASRLAPLHHTPIRDTSLTAALRLLRPDELLQDGHG
jgi:hypothetical protein